MKIKENVTVYSCEHCKKKLFVKHAMETHEKWCIDNPANQPACIMCRNCETYKKEYTYEGEFDGYTIENTHQATAYKCHALSVGVYPMKALKKGLPTKYPETFKGEILMPTDCDKYQFGVYEDAEKNDIIDFLDLGN